MQKNLEAYCSSCPNGSQIVLLIDQLNSALREAGIERSSFGEKYSVYSLRHYHAVNALRTGVGVSFSGRLSIGESVPKSIRSIEARSPTPCGPRSPGTTKIRNWVGYAELLEERHK